MITKLSIFNFKSLEALEIDCNNLNVLTGLNGMGKSSVIQSLLLLRQSYLSNKLQEQDSTLNLNGELVQLGTVKDIFYGFGEGDDISLNIESHNNPAVEWRFSKVAKDEETKEILVNYSTYDYMPFSSDFEIIDSPVISLFQHNKFRYLNADRWVKNEYDISEYAVAKQRSLGKHGEFTAHFLEKYGADPIDERFLYPGSNTNNLLFQVSSWMNEISPGIKVIAEKIQGVDSVKLRYKYENSNMSTDEITPTNIGFGITYCLSIIVALLSSKKDDLLIVENPESHIHPKGQSIIGRLLSLVASTGTQIFVETHSDHVINGILISILQNSRGEIDSIDNERTKINFIKRTDNSFSSENILLEILENGRLKGVPKDFFDQYAKDMKTIIGF